MYKSGKVYFLQRLAEEVKHAAQNSGAEKRKLAEHGDKVEALDLNVQLFLHDSDKLFKLQEKVAALDVGLTAMLVEAFQSTKGSEVMMLNHASLRSELDEVLSDGHIRKICCGTLWRKCVLVIAG